MCVKHITPVKMNVLLPLTGNAAVLHANPAYAGTFQDSCGPQNSYQNSRAVFFFCHGPVEKCRLYTGQKHSSGDTMLPQI